METLRLYCIAVFAVCVTLWSIAIINITTAENTPDFTNMHRVPLSLAHPPPPSRHRPKPWPWNARRLGDGCRHVFLDMGAGAGEYERLLFQPEFFLETPMAKIFDRAFGAPDIRSQPSANSGICAFAFDANPGRATRLHAMQSCFLRMGFRLHSVVSVALANTDDATAIFESDQDSGHVFVRDEPHQFIPGTGRVLSEVTVLDIADFITRHIRDREYEGGKGVVVANVDVGWSTYGVLWRMEAADLLCTGIVDVLVIDTTLFDTHYFENNGPARSENCTPSWIRKRGYSDYSMEDFKHPLWQSCLD
jgi:hypothetical protein